MLQLITYGLRGVAGEISGRMGRLLEKHRMRRQHTEFDGCTFLIDARGTLTAMHDLPGREADRIEVFGTMELAGEDS
jgi:hypothetical protein